MNEEQIALLRNALNELEEAKTNVELSIDNLRKCVDSVANEHSLTNENIASKVFRLKKTYSMLDSIKTIDSELDDKINDKLFDYVRTKDYMKGATKE